MIVDLQELAGKIDRATASLMAETTALCTANMLLGVAEMELQDAENKVVLINSIDPKALGSNEQIRQANIRIQTDKQCRKVTAEKTSVLEAKGKLAVSELVMSNYKMMLKIAELERVKE